MSQKFNWDDFWYVYKAITETEPLYKRDFEEEVEKAKEKLIKLFGSTKIEIEKEINLTLEEQGEITSKYIDSIKERAVKRNFSKKVINKLQKIMLFFLQLDIDKEDLMTGYITKKSRIIKTREDVIPGMKISKALRIILKEKGLEEYTDFLIQDLSILQGQLKHTNSPVKIVVSLEPIDFLLASDVTTGWRTCHSIITGTHPAGNLSYLFDSHTVIAYAYRTEESAWGLKLPKKLWRQWVHIDVKNAIALFQRQYPTEMLSFEKAARFIVGEALKNTMVQKKAGGKGTGKKEMMNATFSTKQK
ncbi:hypothetical protein O163_13770 [Caldanaerobacter subterraneus subsp. yonseiensis KB-1]|uniref:Uncharacterized protein n=1 Tax=Caldanaerobacter subterraneus subsp. yonseiensis KB-1 TaxID=1388761 RepID=U5CD50_CALSX|nr:hypothetical protein [Caldanaerobacter subterraneus]ERM90835.1 hypothetical protein O163_13770 [Caldanaerobacter subterraneus subsp. yonseiensis KB-1]